MGVQKHAEDPSRTIRPVPRSDRGSNVLYASSAFNRLEQTRLWQRVWQVACREEEIPNSGDFVRYDVVDQSIIVLRQGDGSLVAFHNECRRCGGALLSHERGSSVNFSCAFHGKPQDGDWAEAAIKAHDDWSDCSPIGAATMDLKHVLVGTWGGFVFINMDCTSKPLAEFLHPLPSYLDCTKLGSMRLKRAFTAQLRAKWLTAVTSLAENSQLSVLQLLADYMSGQADVREALNLPTPLDLTGARASTLRAAMRVLGEVPANASPVETFRRAIEFMREADAKTAEAAPGSSSTANRGIEWNIFPNISGALSLDFAVFFRARPDSASMKSCCFDVWILERNVPDRPASIDYDLCSLWRSPRSAIPGPILQQLRDIEKYQHDLDARRGAILSRADHPETIQVRNIHRSLQHYVMAGVSESAEITYD